MMTTISTDQQADERNPWNHFIGSDTSSFVDYGIGLAVTNESGNLVGHIGGTSVLLALENKGQSVLVSGSPKDLSRNDTNRFFAGVVASQNVVKDRVPRSETTVIPWEHCWELTSYQLTERFRQISELAEGWDSYGAPPISPDAIKEARNFVNVGWFKGLSDPIVAPGADAGIGIEWKTERGELYIDIVPGEPTTYILTTGESQEDLEGELNEINLFQVINRVKEVPSDIGK